MKHIIRYAPPNSIFFLSDADKEKIPNIDPRPVRIWSTRSCIVIGCLMSQDGETELVLSDDHRDAKDEAPAYDGVVETPRRILEVSTSEREVLLHCDVEGHFTRVRVWTDHPTEPDHILVVLG